MSPEQTGPRYFIDLDWYERHGRSLPALARSRLCPSCASTRSSLDSAEVCDVFRDCCSKQEGFLSPDLPLRELIFRMLLSNGRKPVELGEIATRLRELLGNAGDRREISPTKLKRIVDSDRYYGIAAFPEQARNT